MQFIVKYIHIMPLFRSVRKIAKSDYIFVMSVYPSVRPHGTTWLPGDGFSRNLIFKSFFENLSRKFTVFIEI